MAHIPPVKIKVFAQSATLPKSVVEEILAAHRQGNKSLRYRNVDFQIGLNRSGQPIDIHVVLTRLDQRLPDVFRSEFKVNFVSLLADSFPSDLRAQPGWYVGENHGFSGAVCMVDPTGNLSGDKPIIYANGDNFNYVTQFFRRVMSGELEPGDKYGSIRRRT